MRRRRRNKPLSSINVVPFLDILLVLLVIFLYTAPLFNQGVIDVPSTSGGGAARENAALRVEYSPLNQRAPFSLHNEFSQTEIRDLTEKELIAELYAQIEATDELREIPAPNIPVIIAADRGLKYGAVISLLGELSAAGYTKVGLLTEQTEG